jgi:hypothetical protein
MDTLKQDKKLHFCITRKTGDYCYSIACGPILEFENNGYKFEIGMQKNRPKIENFEQKCQAAMT